MTDRLDEEKLEILRNWGSGLVGDDRDEVRAAGRAILILADEIERLQVELWHARDELAARTAGTAATPQAPEPAAGSPQALGSALRARLAGALAAEPPTPRASV